MNATTTTADNNAARQPAGAGNYSLSFGLASPDGKVMLGPNIEILMHRPRPELASPGTIAYEALNKADGRVLLALLCNSGNSPRMTLAPTYKNLKNGHILKLIEAGTVYLPAEDRQSLVLVFDMPQGRRLMAMSDPKPLHIPPDRIISGLIAPLVAALAELSTHEMIHGHIRPDNLFLIGSGGNETVVLGEPLSSAAFFHSHPILETVARGQAQGSGRGQGMPKNDIYALGVCVALMVREDNITLNRTPEQLIREKLVEGSYASLVTGDKLPAGVSEFLRGVLNDDATLRWDVDTVQRWLEGQHPPSKQPPPVLRAARPFIFRDEKYWDLRSVAMAFTQHVQEGAEASEKDSFDLWLKRNFTDSKFQARIQKAMGREDGAAGSRDRRITNIAIALDPPGPVRYRGAALMPLGFGTALAETIWREADVQVYAEILANQFFSTWMGQVFDEIPNASELLANFEKSRNYILQKMAGYGIERVLYAMNNEAVCMSPVLRRYCVQTPGHLLLALDLLARQPNRPEQILDRHMIAFISVREPKMIDPHLGHVISRDPANRLIGLVRTLAAIQRRFHVAAVPELVKWVLSQVQPAVDRYNDRDLRAEMSRRVAALAGNGNVSAVLDLIDMAAIVQEDTQRFIAARQEYTFLGQQMELIGRQRKGQNFGRDSGNHAAMVISVLMSSFAILAYLIVYYVGWLK